MLPAPAPATTRFEPTCLDVALGVDMAGDAAALRDLLELAEHSLQRDLPQIAQLLAQGDARGANQLLHSIKGFVPIFATEALVQEVSRVEALGKTASANELQVAYAPLASHMHQLLAEISRYLATDTVATPPGNTL